MALFFLCLMFAVLAYVVLDTWRFENLKPVAKLQQLWEEDMLALNQGGRLPSEWSQIREIQLLGGNEESKAWLKQIQIPVHLNKEGTYRLQILLVSWAEEGKIGAYL